MQDVAAGFGTIAAVIGLGYVLAATKVLGADAQAILAKLAFYVATPCLLVTVVGDTDIAVLFSDNLVATVGAIVAAAVPYIVVARWRWHRRADEIAVGTMCSAYGNAGNLGLPIASYVLGDAALIAPLLLFQMLVFQPVGLGFLDAGRAGRVSLFQVIKGPLTNPVTLGTLVGVAIAVSGWSLPAPIYDPIDLVGGMAVPGVLIAYGISLRLGPLPGRGVPASELGFVVAIKLIGQPVAAYLIGRAMGIDGHALLALVVTAALPTAQNIFVNASRYETQALLARDAIFVTTIGSVPVIAFIAAFLL